MTDKQVEKKLYIQSIEGLPLNKSGNEYLQVNSTEDGYKLSTSQELVNQIGEISEKPNTIVDGNNTVIDYSIAKMDFSFLNSNNSNGFIITTNGVGINGDNPVTNAYKAFNGTSWVSTPVDNIWVMIQCPYPIAITASNRWLEGWFSNVVAFNPTRVIIEASNNNVNWTVMIDKTTPTGEFVPFGTITYTFNPTKEKYIYWRVRYPSRASSGNGFYNWQWFAEYDEVNNNATFQKNKITKTKHISFTPLIPFRTTYVDALGGTCGGTGGEYTVSNQYWQAFRGNVGGSNTGYMSPLDVAMPCYVYYQPQQPYEPGYYNFGFESGIWGDTLGYSAGLVNIQVVDENDNVITIEIIANFNYYQQYSKTRVYYIPYRFKSVRWVVVSRYNRHVTLGSCQIYKMDEDAYGQRSYWDQTIYYSQNNTFLCGSTQEQIKYPRIYFDVSVDKPLTIAFPSGSVKTFTNLTPIDLAHRKKYVAQTPIAMSNYTTPIYDDTPSLTEYNALKAGVVSGFGTELDASRQFWRAIGYQGYRGTGDCWLCSLNNGMPNGVIYTWNQIRKPGKYAFQFQNGVWDNTDGYSNSDIEISVVDMNGIEHQICRKFRLANTYFQRYWTRSFDIPYEFNKVIFRCYGRYSNHNGLNWLAVFREEDLSYSLSGDDTNGESIGRTFFLDELQNVFIKESGETYTLSNKVYNQTNEPTDMTENDIWINSISGLPIQYIWKDNKWGTFNDVHISTAIMFGKLLVTTYDKSFNDNGTYLNTDCVWTNEDNSISIGQYDSSNEGVFLKMFEQSYLHGLNITDLSKYKAEVYLKCVSQNYGYEVGDYAMGFELLQTNTLFSPTVPYLDRHRIGLVSSNELNGFVITRKDNGGTVSPNIGDWRIVFKIRKL